VFAARGAKDVPTDKIRSYLSYLTHGHIYSYEGEKTNEGTKTRLLQVINRGSHKPHTRTHIQLEIHIVFSEVLASEKFPRILGEERGGFNRGSHKPHTRTHIQLLTHPPPMAMPHRCLLRVSTWRNTRSIRSAVPFILSLILSAWVDLASRRGEYREGDDNRHTRPAARTEGPVTSQAFRG